jgi:hypothetical protein
MVYKLSMGLKTGRKENQLQREKKVDVFIKL